MQALVKGLEEMTPLFEEAAKIDLGYNKFTNYLLNTGNCLGQIKYILNNFQSWAKSKSVDTPLLVGPAKSYLKPESLGVVLVMGAWNYPLFTAVCPAANGIAAGNCVMIKPSEMTPNTSKLLKELFEKYMDP